MDSFIPRMIRRALIARLVGCGVGIVFIGWLTYLSRDDIRGINQEPRMVTAADLDTLRGADGTSQFMVKVQGSNIFDTRYEDHGEDSHGHQTVTDRFYFLTVGKKYLIVRSLPGEMDEQVQGTLGPVPNDFDRNWFAAREWKAQRNRFYPFALDAISRTGDNLFEAGLLLVGALVAILVVGFAWNQLRHFKDHPVLARIRWWGDLSAISAAVEKELRAPNVVRVGGWGTWILTDHYMVRRGLFSFDLHRFHDLLWAYAVTGRVYTQGLRFSDSNGAFHYYNDGMVFLPDFRRRLDKALQFAQSKAPWAFFGKTPELEQRFWKDQAGFVAEVQERRRQAEGG